MGVDFNCKGASCYGIGDRERLFRQLQTLINAALMQLGVGTPIAVDGFLGPDTITALLMLAKLPPYMASPAIVTVKNSPKPSTVAQIAPDLVTALTASSNGTSASQRTTQAIAATQTAQVQVAKVGAQVPALPAAVPNPSVMPSSSDTPPPGKSHVGWWLAGLGGAALVGFLLVHVAHRHDDGSGLVEPPP